MRIIFKTLFGSHLYGTDTPESDLDFKAVAIPSSREILLQKAFRSINEGTKEAGRLKNNADDTDMEIFSLHQFIKLCDEGQTVALDMLFAPGQFWREIEPTWGQILCNRHRLLHSGTSAFVGYCQHQAAKYGIKGSRVNAVQKAIGVFNSLAVPDHTKLREVWGILLNTLEGEEHIRFIEMETPGPLGEPGKVRGIEVCGRKLQEGVTIKYALGVLGCLDKSYGERARKAASNEGIDWKALSHALRVCFEAQELLATGQITFPLPQKELLLQVKKGELPYSIVGGMIDEEIAKVEEIKKTSQLPESIDRKYWEEFILRIYGEEVAK